MSSTIARRLARLRARVEREAKPRVHTGGSPEWTAERTAQLERWHDKLPMSEIAKRIGCSRNSIAGKIYRMRRRSRLTPARASQQQQPLSLPRLKFMDIELSFA